MAKKELWEIVDDELQKTAEKICKQCCKYYDQYDKETKTIGSKNETYVKHCLKCPIIGWFH